MQNALISAAWSLKTSTSATRRSHTLIKTRSKKSNYSFNENYNLANRIDATREELIKILNRKITPETKKAWVAHTIEGMSQQELNDLYDRPDQEFESEAKEEAFLGRKIVFSRFKGRTQAYFAQPLL